MKTIQKMACFLAIAIVSAAVFFACTKSGVNEQTVPAGRQQVNFYLTDGPGFFDHVYLDVRSVQVLVDTCDRDRRNWRGEDNRDTTGHCKVWDSLAIRPGVYDLLSFRNGVDTLFANGIIPDGRIIRIKVNLGTNNSLVKDSVTYPLNLAGNSSSIILSLRGDEFEEFSTGRYRLWMDFDVERSIVLVRHNEFVLNPVIHLFVVKATGAIQGTVLPRDAYPVLTIYNNTDTAYALPNRDGQFMVRGLLTGSYSVLINASNGYRDTTIANVSVQIGKATNMGRITLHK